MVPWDAYFMINIKIDALERNARAHHSAQQSKGGEEIIFENFDIMA